MGAHGAPMGPMGAHWAPPWGPMGPMGAHWAPGQYFFWGKLKVRWRTMIKKFDFFFENAFFRYFFVKKMKILIFLIFWLYFIGNL